MNVSRKLSIIAVLCGALALPGARADFTCDFEKGLPEGWTLEQGHAELETLGGNTVLELGKNALMSMGDAEYLNFSIEGRLRREYDTSGSHVGFQFRNGYRVYLRKPGRIELIGPNGAKGRGFSRNLSTYQPVSFKIVVVGPTVRFFVNGRFEGQFDELEMTPGPLGLYQKGMAHNVYFDDLRVVTDLAPAQYLVCDAVTGEDRTLLFDPNEDISLSITLRNHADTAQEAALGLRIATFDDQLVAERTMPATSIGAGEAATVDVDLGRIPEGYYRITFEPTGKALPLAVHERGMVTHDQIVMPKIMTGVYWYYFGWQGMPDLWWNTYVHAAAADLRRHNFNTVICAIGMPTEAIEILGQYGIRCFTRGEGAGGNVSHPNVIGGFIGDEPHKGQEKRYIRDYTRLLEEYPDKLWTTCMIGDGGVGGCQPWWDTWNELPGSDRVVRMLRWYGIKNYIAGIQRTYAKIPPLTETLRDLSEGKGPYYFIMPSFGDNENVNAYFSNPLPSQARVMMHLAAAFEAKGLFFWTYQTPFPDHDAIVDPVSLLPLDGKWAAMGEAAGKILGNAELLAECAWNGRYRFVDAPALLEVFELGRPDDPARYFYVVNKNTVKTLNGRIFKLDRNATMHDLFADRPVPIVEETVVSMRPDLQWETGVAKVELAPGDGVLLRYAPPAETEGEAAAAPRVVYPERVAEAGEDRIVWLDDLEPLEQPHPGWIPQVKFRGKSWYPDYHSNDLKLYSGLNDGGQLYKRSLWAHAETTIRYAIPEGAATLAAAAGFANRDKRSSAIFRVLVDGVEKYNSEIMTIETGVQPVVVDIRGGQILELITEEAGDGLYGDYTFWGEARLIKE